MSTIPPEPHKIGTSTLRQATHLPTPFENLAILRKYLDGHTWTHYEAQRAAERLEKQIENLLQVAGFADRVTAPAIDDMSEEERIEFLARHAVYSVCGESNENTDRMIAAIIQQSKRRQQASSAAQTATAPPESHPGCRT